MTFYFQYFESSCFLASTISVNLLWVLLHVMDLFYCAVFKIFSLFCLLSSSEKSISLQCTACDVSFLSVKAWEYALSLITRDVCGLFVYSLNLSFPDLPLKLLAPLLLLVSHLNVSLY